MNINRTFCSIAEEQPKEQTLQSYREKARELTRKTGKEHGFGYSYPYTPPHKSNTPNIDLPKPITPLIVGGERCIGIPTMLNHEWVGWVHTHPYIPNNRCQFSYDDLNNSAVNIIAKEVICINSHPSDDILLLHDFIQNRNEKFEDIGQIEKLFHEKKNNEAYNKLHQYNDLYVRMYLFEKFNQY